VLVCAIAVPEMQLIGRGYKVDLNETCIHLDKLKTQMCRSCPVEQGIQILLKK